jgi:hypothetical protein
VRFDLCAGEGWKSSSRHLDGSDGRKLRTRWRLVSRR